MCTVFHSGFIVNLKRCPWYEKECHFSAYFFCARLSIWSLVFSKICKGSPQRGKVFGHLISNVHFAASRIWAVCPKWPKKFDFASDRMQVYWAFDKFCTFDPKKAGFLDVDLRNSKQPNQPQPTLTLSCLLGSPLKKNSVLPPFWGYPKGSPISMAKLAKREIVFWP